MVRDEVRSRLSRRRWTAAPHASPSSRGRGWRCGPGRVASRRCAWSSACVPRRAERESVEVSDGTYPGRVGWKAVIAAPGTGTAVRSDVPASDPTNGLRVYPDRLLESPSDVRDASLERGPRRGHARRARRAPGPALGRGRRALVRGPLRGRGGREGRAGLPAARRLRLGSAARALTRPRQGDGGRLSDRHERHAKHAVALGATVTITHTIGVFALGFVTLALSAYILPEDLYPWLTLVSGLWWWASGPPFCGGGSALGAPPLRTPHSAHHHHHAHDSPGVAVDRHGRCSRPHPVSLGAGGAARRHLAARGGTRAF